MTFRGALREGSHHLAESGNDAAYLDALVLLAFATQSTKEHIYASLVDILPDVSYDIYRGLIERRIEGTPVAYLIKGKEFYGRVFYVDERVLIPRPDTETLIETVLHLLDEDDEIRRVHDVGTGSGCIALTLKAERPSIEISASDPSFGACEVFSINAHRFGVSVPLHQSPYLKSLSGVFDLIVSNPPYLTDSEADIMKEEEWPEPQNALRAGADGLDCIAQIICESVHYLRRGGRLLLEAAPTQMPKIRDMLKSKGFERLLTVSDLAGRERVVGGVKNG